MQVVFPSAQKRTTSRPVQLSGVAQPCRLSRADHFRALAMVCGLQRTS